MTKTLKSKVDLLYTGRSRRAVRFRYALIIFDALTITYFIATAPFAGNQVVTLIDHLIAVPILLDFLARLWIAPDRWHMLTRLYTIADLIVIGSLLAESFFLQNLGFLRILRGLRLIHSYHLLRDLRRESRFFRRHEDTVLAAINLLVFVFVTTSAVYALYFRPTAGPESYIDALYFTVATLTTTGFGDITMTTPVGKLLSVFIMVVGVALFVQLARAIFQPSKVRYTCPECGLQRHDIDAVHCKHCGHQLKIRTEGVE